MWTILIVLILLFLCRDIILPFEDGSFGLEFVNEAPSGSRPTTGHGGLHLTKASMAGLVGTGKENVDPC